MPFEYSVAHAFTARSIRAHAPERPGVYGISNSREWIFVGRCDDIRLALMSHLSEPGSTLIHKQPTGFVYEICFAERRDDRCERLIVEYAPTCNPSARSMR